MRSPFSSPLLLLVSIPIVLGACGGPAEDEPSSADAESEALVSNEEATCPVNTDMNTDFRTCESDSTAVGPFPKAMVDKCRARGAAYCARAYWPSDVAHTLRGQSYCPLGTTLDDALGVCVDGEYAYGPFSRGMIDFCRRQAGDKAAECDAMEWKKEWVPTPADNDDDATPGEIEAPTPLANMMCSHANGYRKGKSFSICVSNVDGKLVEVHTARAFRKMQDAARRDHVLLKVVSGFRTMEKQRQLYRLYKSGRGALAATPGYSNHQSGTALDLNTASRGVYAWLALHADDYGFRRTVRSEKWHFEWDGDTSE